MKRVLKRVKRVRSGRSIKAVDEKTERGVVANQRISS